MRRDLNEDLLWDSHCEWHSPELAALVAANVLPQGRVLDLGCGVGVESFFLARHGWTVAGIDSNPRMIEEAVRRRELLSVKARRRVSFRCGDFTQRRNWPKAASQNIVMERLLFTNLDPRSVRRQPNLWYATARTALIDLAAKGLTPKKGVFIMRIAPAALTEWQDVDGSSIGESDLSHLERYFKPAPEVGYVGMVTDPTHSDEAYVVAPKKMSIMLWWRNGRRFTASSKGR